QTSDADKTVIRLDGPATAREIGSIVPAIARALAVKKRIALDLSATTDIDARFCGLLLQLTKMLRPSGAALILAGLAPRMARTLRRYGLAFLLPADAPPR